MPDTPLNPDALEAAARVANEEGWTCHEGSGEPGNFDTCEECQRVDKEHAHAIVTAYLADAQPEVTSVEELDALPPESYVQGWDGFKHAKTHSGKWVLCVEHTCGAHDAESIELPARVLYRGVES